MAEPWHLGPLCAFDTETTGTDTGTDRVVTACVAWLDGTGKTAPQVQSWLADPDMEIPEAAAKINGITTGHAREHGLPAARVIAEITAVILDAAAAGTPVIAYNAPFDLTLLDRESRRHGLDPFGPALDRVKALIIDPFVIWGALDPGWRGKRTLTAAAGRWGVTQDGAHSASGDAVTAARLAWKIAASRPHVAAMSATELHAWQVRERCRQADSLRTWRANRGYDTSDIDDAWPWRPVPGEEAA